MKYSNSTSTLFVCWLKNTFFCSLFLFFQCAAQKNTSLERETSSYQIGQIRTGAEQTERYFPLLKEKKVAVVTNSSGIIARRNRTYTHLIDTLLSRGIQVVKVFAPEHGFRGTADAGAIVTHQVDEKTQLPILSLYGKHKKPSPSQLKDVDIVLFDLQDVGVRFYTYISTLHYVMEACAEANIPIIVLDRPNPNAHYIDGPVLQPEFKSFVGMHPVPVVYGMTIGEYAQMINGEKWLNNGIQAHLKVIPLEHYTHTKTYSPPVKPSPNLPNEKAINLYPSLCFFEGTNVSVGRGTPFPFQIFGSPYLHRTNFSFTPSPTEGAQNPIWNAKKCWGKNLQNEPYLSEIQLKWLISAFQQTAQVKTSFFLNSGRLFDLLAGTDQLRKQIQQGVPIEDIKKSWQPGLREFQKTRQKYLIYPI